MLTEAEKTDTRRFCGYPTLHIGQFQAPFAALEFRLTHLSTAETTVLRDYLSTLRTLEQAIPAAAGNLDTAQVSLWSRNPNELRDRTKLFESWRRRLCDFLAIPPGQNMASGGVTFIV